LLTNPKVKRFGFSISLINHVSDGFSFKVFSMKIVLERKYILETLSVIPVSSQRIKGSKHQCKNLKILDS
jgi:hypothetical protein